MGSKKGRRRGEETGETAAADGRRENGEIVAQNGTGVDLNDWVGDKRVRKRKFGLNDAMKGSERVSSSDQLNGRKVGEERKKKEKKEKNRGRKIDGDAYRCSVGEFQDDGSVKEGKFDDSKEKKKKNRKVKDPGGEKDQMEKRKKKYNVDKHRDEMSNTFLGGHGGYQDSEKMEPMKEEKRKGETSKELKNKMKQGKKSNQMQIELAIDKAGKNRGEVHELEADTCIKEEKSDNICGKNKKEKLGRRNLDLREDNQVIVEQSDIFTSEVTNGKQVRQTGKRKRDGSGCSDMNGGEEYVGQSKCKDREPLASEDDAHLTYTFEEEGGCTPKIREKKQKRTTLTENSSKRNGQEEKDDDVSTVVTNNETPGKVSSKKVAFADTVEVFPPENSEQVVLSGKRYTKEEDELLERAIFDYIESHELGEKGVEMLLNCTKYKLRGCWKEIGKSLPWRDSTSVYLHGIMLLAKGGKKIPWTPEDHELIRQYHKKHGSKWSTLAKALGRYRYDVKDAFRSVGGGPVKKGKWDPEELDELYNLVNKDLRSRYIHERKTHQGFFRDNIPWTSIGEQMGTRHFAACCSKWYSITSPMVSEKIWNDTDDYRLVDALAKLDMCSFVDVDWDNLLEHRSGDVCIRRWKELIRTVDRHYTKSFMELVEILSQRYSWDVLEAKEAHDAVMEDALCDQNLTD